MKSRIALFESVAGIFCHCHHGSHSCREPIYLWTPTGHLSNNTCSGIPTFDVVLLVGLTELKAEIRWFDTIAVRVHGSFWLNHFC